MGWSHMNFYCLIPLTSGTFPPPFCPSKSFQLVISKLLKLFSHLPNSLTTWWLIQFLVGHYDWGWERSMLHVRAASFVPLTKNEWMRGILMYCAHPEEPQRTDSRVRPSHLKIGWVLPSSFYPQPCTEPGPQQTVLLNQEIEAQLRRCMHIDASMTNIF